MGFGDVKLGAALGAGLGLVDPRTSVLALCLGSIATAAVGVARRRVSMPVAPGLVLGAAMSVGLAAALEERAWPWR